MLVFTKAIRAARVYAKNNAMYQRFIDTAHDGLTRVLAELGELGLSVREDRLLFEQQAVYENDDLREGLPFLLYNHSFRRMTFLEGMTRSEMEALITTLNADRTDVDLTGEDLVSALWRLNLPHLRYTTIDAFQLSSPHDSDEDPEQTLDQIQEDIEAILAAVYRTTALDDDLVAGVSLGREDLEALRELRRGHADAPELHEDDGLLLPGIPSEQREAVLEVVGSERLDMLMMRVFGVLAGLVIAGRNKVSGSATLVLLQQIYDAQLLARRYATAKRLVEGVRTRFEDAQGVRDQHIARHLLRLLSSDERVLGVLQSLNERHPNFTASELVGFLRTLGSEAAPALLRGLEHVDSSTHRKFIRDLIIEIGVPDIPTLEAQLVEAKWFVVREILELARQHPPALIGSLVRFALAHEHPRVRAHAVRILRDDVPGADVLLGKGLLDSDAEVRVLAARIAAARRSQVVLPIFERILAGDDLEKRDERELRMLLVAFAMIGGRKAAEPLKALLGRSMLERIRGGSDLEVAAAHALARVPVDASREALQRGTRSMSHRVREACRTALQQLERQTTTYRSSRPEAERVESPGLFDDLPSPSTSFVPESASPGRSASEASPKGPSTRRNEVPELLPSTRARPPTESDDFARAVVRWGDDQVVRAPRGNGGGESEGVP
ncbi:MAG: hypothetical protein AAFU79_07200 [Myxococcota bacterium]